jgi:lysine 2,3-aminomutase
MNNRKKYFPDILDENWNDWQWQLRNVITEATELKKFFPEIDVESTDKVAARFPFSVTPYFLSLINNDVPLSDPVGKQIIPDIREFDFDSRLILDPFREETERSPLPCVVQRYPDRIILVTTNFCPAKCRYCTRKWNWDKCNTLTAEMLKDVVAYLKSHPQIREVILTGGEPFLLNLKFLDNILSAISSVDSIEVIRIGSRILSFLPQRITDDVTAVLSKYSPIWIVTHFNHPNEFTQETENAVKKILRSGCALCNQSVLLKDINDNAEVMKELVHALQNILIKPYYIFHPDLIEGTSHFRGSIENGIQIMKSLRGYTGGICVPYYVVDLPEGGKVPLLPEYILKKTENGILFSNYEDKEIFYNGNS